MRSCTLLRWSCLEAICFSVSPWLCSMPILGTNFAPCWWVEPVKENLNKAAFCCDSYGVFELEINMQMVENEQLSGNHQRLQAKRDQHRRTVSCSFHTSLIVKEYSFVPLHSMWDIRPQWAPYIVPYPCQCVKLPLQFSSFWLPFTSQFCSRVRVRVSILQVFFSLEESM